MEPTRWMAPRQFQPYQSMKTVNGLYIVSCFHNLGTFFISKPESDICWDKLKTVNTYYYDQALDWGKDGGKEADPQRFKPCVAMYASNKMYYRGLIVDMNKSQATVLFVDYGNLQETPLSELKEMHPKFITTPKLAVNCKLYGYEDFFGVNNPELDSAIQSILAEGTTLRATFVNSTDAGIRPVILHHDQYGDVMAHLMTVASKKRTSLLTVPDDFAHLASGFAKCPWDSARCRVTCVNSITEFYIQPYPDEVLTLDVEIAEEVFLSSSSSSPSSPQFHVNTSCLAFYQPHQCHHRASITAIDDDDVSVFFCDYGYSETVNKKLILELPQRFARIPAMVEKCSLFELGEKSVNEEMINAFKELVIPMSPPFPLFTVQTKNYDAVVKVSLITEEGVNLWEKIKIYDSCVPSTSSLSLPSSHSCLSSSSSSLSVMQHPPSLNMMRTVEGPLPESQLPPSQCVQQILHFQQDSRCAFTVDYEKFPFLGTFPVTFLRTLKILYIFGPQCNELLMVDKQDAVFASGCSTTDSDLFSTENALQIRAIPELCYRGIIDFTSGFEYILALSSSGKVFAWNYRGLDKSPMIRRGFNIRYTPSIVTGLQDKFMTAIACGESHCLALSREGRIYSWGANTKGEVGTGSEIPVTWDTPYAIQLDCNIVSIACGDHFSVVIEEHGKVYLWGCNENGQLGNGDVVNVRKPVRLHLQNMRKVVCGSDYCLALTKEGKLFSWGANQYGQLGTGGLEREIQPYLVEFPSSSSFFPSSSSICSSSYSTSYTVEDIAVCRDFAFSAARLVDGKVYVWGCIRGHAIVKPILSTCQSVEDAFAFYIGKPWKSLQLPSRETSSIMATLAASFNDKDTSDFCFKVEDREIWVHKSILKMRSEYFRTLLDERWMDPAELSKPMDPLSYPVFYAVLKFIYTDECDIPPEKHFLTELLGLADYYLLETLKLRCEEKIREAVSVETVIDFLQAALDYNSKTLQSYCKDFIRGHFDAVSKTDSFQNLPAMTKLFLK